jgi:uncharacterized membrane protein YcaP (DUF421 family)
MKNKIIVFAIALLLVVSTLVLSAFAPQEAHSKYITMKTFEYEAIFESKIVIVYENGQMEEFDLEKAKKQANIINNMRKINETFNTLGKKGYRLVSSSGEMTSMTYVFEKK